MPFTRGEHAFRRTVWALYRWWLDLLLPPCCVVCQRVGTWLCEVCTEKIPFFEQDSCPRCGRPWRGSGLCRVCQSSTLRVNPIHSVFLFDGKVRDIVHALKYRGGIGVAEALGGRMVTAWKRDPLESSLLVPVPLFPTREAQRGYNQAALLAESLGTRLALPVSAALHRTRNTPSQTQLSREERKQNVEDAFAVNSEVDIAGKSITLIDDVATTGATLDACAVALLGAGARVVNAFTLARAP